MPTVVLPVTLQKVAPDVSSAPLCLSPCKIFVPSVLFTKGSKFFFLPVFSYVCGLSSFSTPGSLSRCKKFCRVLSAVWQAHRQKVLKYKKKLSEQKKNFPEGCRPRCTRFILDFYLGFWRWESSVFEHVFFCFFVVVRENKKKYNMVW